MLSAKETQFFIALHIDKKKKSRRDFDRESEPYSFVDFLFVCSLVPCLVALDLFNT